MEDDSGGDLEQIEIGSPTMRRSKRQKVDTAAPAEKVCLRLKESCYF